MLEQQTPERIIPRGSNPNKRKRIFRGMAGSPLAKTELVSVQKPKRGRPCKNGAPMTPAERKNASRTSKELAELLEEQAKDNKSGGKYSGDSFSKHNTGGGVGLKQADRAAAIEAQENVYGGRRAFVAGNPDNADYDSRETDHTHVNRQRFGLNWGLSIEELDEIASLIFDQNTEIYYAEDCSEDPDWNPETREYAPDPTPPDKSRCKICGFVSTDDHEFEDHFFDAVNFGNARDVHKILVEKAIKIAKAAKPKIKRSKEVVIQIDGGLYGGINEGQVMAVQFKDALVMTEAVAGYVIDRLKQRGFKYPVTVRTQPGRRLITRIEDAWPVIEPVIS